MVLCGRGKKERKILILLRGRGKERKLKEESGFGREDLSPRTRQTRRRDLVRLVAADSLPCIKILAGGYLRRCGALPLRWCGALVPAKSDEIDQGRGRRVVESGGGGRRWWWWLQEKKEES